MELLHHVINAVPVAQGPLLAALSPVGPKGDVALFFKSGFPDNAITNVPGFQVRDLRSIGNGIQVTGKAEITDGRVRLPLSGPAQHVAVQAPYTDLFEGLTTAMALRLVETPKTIVEWLRYHARHHGLQAALLVDRALPGQQGELAEALQSARVKGIKRVVILSFDVPLGRDDMGDETLPYYAPDAPGKDRMEVPPSDPWRAPFAEMVLYEMLRHAYLARARAVMNIDLSDLIAPIEGATIFQRAAQAPNGAVTLAGHRIYPWGIKKGKLPQFGDHICRRFDARPGNARWCLDLGQEPDNTVWRLIRVVGTEAAVPHVLPYLRCMGLRHPTEKIAEIAPKTSLIEDETLLDLMMSEFKHKPQRAPEQELKPTADRRTNHTGIVTTMKNEGPFILEWIAYHKAIGVKDFLVYTNDCTDGTDTLLELLQTKGVLQHRDNPFQKLNMKPQHGALHAADSEPIIQALDWVVCMDVDEFINIHVGDGMLEDLYEATGDANMISMTWRLFGNGDVEKFRDGFIIDEFIDCAPEFVRKPHQAWGFKTLTRNAGIFKKLGVHRPKGLRPQLVDEVRWVNGSGKAMPREDYRNAWRSTTETYGYDLVTLNHYALRSAESFLVKRDRGRVNHVDRDQGLIYWFRMNNNAEQDRSIQRMSAAARLEYDKLLADPDIAAQHRACVKAHRAKIDELLATERYSEFYREICSPRLRALSRMLQHFGSNVFMSGPDCIPDQVLQHAGDERFFFTVKEIVEAD